MMAPVDIQLRRVALPGLLEVAKQAVLEQFHEELIKAGYGDIRPTHGCVFRFVGEEGMRLTDLAGNARMTKQSCGELVDDLVKLGYVERIPDPADRRAKLICLTERGQTVKGIGYEIFTELEQRWADRYGADRIALLRELLEEIAAGEAPGAVPELVEQQLTEP